ncbi:hypothetical protein DXG01_005603 [Tephrocybe rancida]|nr:hypothetical protein DXG01_005603 [Tephrocybe rancida]
MNGYVNGLSGAPILSAHSVSSGQNSLQGALKSGPEPMKRTPSTSSKSPHISAQPLVSDGKVKSMGTNDVISASLDQDMQRQLADYNRSITIVVWYRAGTDPIRLQHMNATFPYFQLLQLDMLVTDLALTPNSFIDTFDPQSGTWEQHTMNTVRIVGTQQRLLYKVRRSLLDGLSEHECPGLPDEVGSQTASQYHAPKHEQSHTITVPAPRKRPPPEEPSSEPVQKVHIPNHYYSTHTASPAGLPQTQMPPPIPETPGVVYVNGSYPTYAPQMFYPNPTPAAAAPATSSPAPIHATPPIPAPAPVAAPSPPPDPTLSPHLSANQVEPLLPSTSAPMAPIPYHTHPPLKRWPNDYTVSELTNGFHAMEVLVRDGGGRGTGTGAMTQRAAFERVFGSRYVKSTVCRHRGVWRKAAGPLREQFERMGTDERACWGEFVRRVEGRPPGKAVQVQMQMQGIGVYHPRAGADAVVGADSRAVADAGASEEPVMASLQDPDGQGTTTFS